jgi:hypothetical protein
VPVVADFVIAVAVATGEKQEIPAEWLALSDAGVPGFNFKLPPSARAKETPTEAAPSAVTPKEN